jgi:hypothetical protein
VDGFHVGWPLGYMIDKLNSGETYLPSEVDSRVLPYFAYIIIVVGLALVIIIPSFMFVFYLCVHRRRRPPRNNVALKKKLANSSTVKI